MITHKIVIAKPAREKGTSDDRFTGTYGTVEHKKFIHRRAFTKCKLHEGQHVRYNGKMGIIVDILDEDAWDAIEWTDLECRFVHVFFYDDQSEELFHPNSLKVY